MLPGETSPEKVFNADIGHLIQSETRQLNQDRNDALLEAFNPERFHADVRDQAARSLGVSDDFLSSPEGEQIFNEIESFLIQDQHVQKLESVATALMSMLNSMMVPTEARYPEGLAKMLHAHISRKRQREQVERGISEHERIWKPRAY